MHQVLTHATKRAHSVPRSHESALWSYSTELFRCAALPTIAGSTLPSPQPTTSQRTHRQAGRDISAPVHPHLGLCWGFLCSAVDISIVLNVSDDSDIERGDKARCARPLAPVRGSRITEKETA